MAAEAYLFAVLEIQTGLQAARDLDTRIQKMQADGAAFEGEVLGLVESLDPELRRFAPEQAIVQLHQALTSAKANLKLLQREEATKKDWEEEAGEGSRRRGTGWARTLPGFAAKPTPEIRRRRGPSQIARPAAVSWRDASPDIRKVLDGLRRQDD